MFMLASGLETFLESDNSIVFVIFTIGGSIAIIGILATVVRGIILGRAKEQTRRELAAYVAEGTLDVDKAIAMMNAGRSTTEEQVGPGGVVTTKKSCC